MNFEQLCDIGREARERALVQIGCKRGVPIGGKFGSRFQDQVLANAMAQYIIANGPIRIEGMTIGLSPAASHSAIVRSTDNVKFAGLRRRLRLAVMDGFEKEIVDRWAAYKTKRGDFVPTGKQTEADRFNNQTFRGFD